jgi:hypothetical protein
MIAEILDEEGPMTAIGKEFYNAAARLYVQETGRTEYTKSDVFRWMGSWELRPRERLARVWDSMPPGQRAKHIFSWDATYPHNTDD